MIFKIFRDMMDLILDMLPTLDSYFYFFLLHQLPKLGKNMIKGPKWSLKSKFRNKAKKKKL